MKATWYYIDENGDKKGPFSFDELKESPLSEDTLVWTESMQDWEKAKNVPLLDGLWTKAPPPTPKEKVNSDQSSEAGSEEQVEEQKGERKFTDGLFKALLLTVGVPFFTFMSDAKATEMGNRYYITSGLIAVATILVLIDLKRYLNSMNSFSRANGMISMIILLEIVGYAIDYFYPIHQLDFETASTAVIIGILGAAALYLIVQVILAIQLLTMKNDFSGWAKPFACSVFVAITGTVISSFNEEYMFIGACLTALPFLVLVLLFGVTNYKMSEEG